METAYQEVIRSFDDKFRLSRVQVILETEKPLSSMLLRRCLILTWYRTSGHMGTFIERKGNQSVDAMGSLLHFICTLK